MFFYFNSRQKPQNTKGASIFCQFVCSEELHNSHLFLRCDGLSDVICSALILAIKVSSCHRILECFVCFLSSLFVCQEGHFTEKLDLSFSKNIQSISRLMSIPREESILWNWTNLWKLDFPTFFLQYLQTIAENLRAFRNPARSLKFVCCLVEILGNLRNEIQRRSQFQKVLNRSGEFFSNVPLYRCLLGAV